LDAVGTKKLGWHDLLAFVKDTRAGSALAIALHGERARWTDREYLMAMMVDALNGANWQRTGKRSGRPKPVVRPGQVSAGEAQHIGDGALPVDEFDIWLADKQAEATPDDENQQSVGGGSLMEPSPTLPQVDVTTPESGSLQR
jgi:hypothetical protein